MNTNEQEINYDFLDSLQVPWFDLENAAKGVLLSYRHALTWDISQLPGSDSPNASTSSLNWQVEQYMTHLMAGYCRNTFIGRGNPNWVYWMLNEKRITSDLVELNKDKDFLCLELSGEYWVERLKDYTMRLQYCLPTIDSPISQRLELLHRFFFRYCTVEGRKFAEDTTVDDEQKRELLRKWRNENTTVDAVLFLPAVCAMNHQCKVANAVSELGGALECLFKEKIDGASGFFVLSVKRSSKNSDVLNDCQGARSKIAKIAGILDQVEKGLRKVLKKHYSLEMFMRLSKCEKLLMGAPAIEPSDAIRALAMQMLGMSLGYFPENDYAMFKELIGNMGEMTLAKLTRGQGSREAARINLIRKILLNSANGGNCE